MRSKQRRTTPSRNSSQLPDDLPIAPFGLTWFAPQEGLAASYGHLTARQAGRIAARAGVRTLVLTHISERYEQSEDPLFAAQAGQEFDGRIVLAQDLDRIPLPARDS
ncbi:hypothetical protein GCM10009551_085060 [Nocardiopsis tropica]